MRRRTRANTCARANRYLADKHDRKKNNTRGATDCSWYFLFARPLPADIGSESITDRIYPSGRNVLRRRLSYESALNASSNEINMPDGNFRGDLRTRTRHGEPLRIRQKFFDTEFESRNHARVNRPGLETFAKADNTRKTNMIDSIFYEDCADRFSIYPLTR